jgi:hypothetical protein
MSFSYRPLGLCHEHVEAAPVTAGSAGIEDIRVLVGAFRDTQKETHTKESHNFNQGGCRHMANRARPDVARAGHSISPERFSFIWLYSMAAPSVSYSY